MTNITPSHARTFRYFYSSPVLGEMEIFVESYEEAKNFIENMFANNGKVRLIIRTYEVVAEEYFIIDTDY